MRLGFIIQLIKGWQLKAQLSLICIHRIFFGSYWKLFVHFNRHTGSDELNKCFEYCVCSMASLNVPLQLSNNCERAFDDIILTGCQFPSAQSVRLANCAVIVLDTFVSQAGLQIRGTSPHLGEAAAVCPDCCRKGLICCASLCGLFTLSKSHVKMPKWLVWCSVFVSCHPAWVEV